MTQGAGQAAGEMSTSTAIADPAINADEIETLRRVLEGTARTTGEGFFQSLVRHLAQAVDAHHAFIAEFASASTHVRTIAYWMRDHYADPIEWALVGTPCEDVIEGKLCHHPAGVWKKFPDDRPLVEMKIESYLGVPLLDAAGATIGHMAVMDERPMPAEPRRLYTFRIFAERAAAELERVHIEQKVRASQEQFRDLFEEAPIGYVYEDTQTRFVSANRAAQQILGLKPEEVVGTVGLTLVADTPENQRRVRESIAAEQAGRELPFIELELRRRDNGKPVWIQRFSRPEPDGKHTRTMLVDITDRVLAEREKAHLQQQNTYLQEEIKTEYNFEEIIGHSAGLRRVLQKVEQVARTDSTVLILGETGTGKELIARAIHDASKRRERPLIKLNCAALPTGLVESELFGHEKGAFTGAVERRVGRFALADGGTIFLDEIGDMPPEVQVKLLRVLQEQEFEPVGATRTQRVNVRVIAATNRNLEQAVSEGKFRADLYYRLQVFPINLPPLRERKDDIPLLVHYFVTRYAARIGKSIAAVPPDVMQRLADYTWPGNIRELENVIERAIILSPGPSLQVDPEILPASSSLVATARASGESSSTGVGTLADNERRHILDALRTTRWVIDGQRGAAKILGLHPNTLRSRMKKLDIRRESHDPS